MEKRSSKTCVSYIYKYTALTDVSAASICQDQMQGTDPKGKTLKKVELQALHIEGFLLFPTDGCLKSFANQY